VRFSPRVQVPNERPVPFHAHKRTCFRAAQALQLASVAATALCVSGRPRLRISLPKPWAWGAGG